MTFRKNTRLMAAVLLLGLPLFTLAHENYVLSQDQITKDLAYQSPSPFTALNAPGNLKVAAIVGFFCFLAIVLYFLFQRSRAGRAFDAWMQKLESYGHVILRVALGVSLIASAHFNSFLGPEIPLASIPFGEFLKPALYILGTLVVLGLWSEIVGALSLAVLLLATWIYKDYMLTYFNYFGEFVALLFFGSRIFSLDKIFYKTREWIKKYRDYEVALIRITYGISVLHPAIVYKLIHPQIIVDIAERYNLMQFHWLFPQDPLLIALGTGLAQVAVGLCIILGFQTRLNSFITLILYGLSIIFFKEAVWPHYILLALALYLIINNGGRFTLDNYLLRREPK